MNIIHMIQGQSHKLKTIEHYVLQNMFLSTPLAQFWTASHKVLKKQFVVKKIKSTPAIKSHSQTSFTFDNFELAKIQTSLLGNIKTLSSPKCQKLIRTSHSLYIVYSPFPGKKLSEMLHENKMNGYQVLSVMIMIAEELISVHEAGAIICNLEQSNIYVNRGKSIFFGDWTLSRAINSQIDHQLMTVMGGVPSFVKNNYQANWKIDVYLFGMLLKRVMKNIKVELSPGLAQKLQIVITSMITNNEEQLMEFKGIIKLLRQILRSLEAVQPETPKFSVSTRTNLSKKDTYKSTGLQKVKSSKNIMIVNSDHVRSSRSILTYSRVRSSTPDDVEKRQNYTSRIKIKNPSNNQDSLSGMAKQLLKKRAYFSFLLQLSLFVKDLNSQICMLLVKIATKSIEDIEEMTETIKEQSVILALEVRSITKDEKKKIHKIMFMFKTNYHNLDINQSTAISPKPVDCISLNLKIKTLARAELHKSLNEMSFKQKSEFYFKLYELCMSIQYGSFEQFWDKKYNPELAPHRQTFLSSEKCLGMRYFRGKIEQALQMI